MKRRGFSLIEVLLALSLLGVFLLIASRVIVANFHTQAANLAAEGNTARFDRAVIMLREDVANSKSVEMPEAAVLRIHLPDNQTVEWRADHHSLSRSASDNRTWDIVQSLKFKLDGAVVLLSDGTDEIAMAGGAR
jgi:prepilin-type N-terminal cleavage/methylation domain-containing protein